MGGVYPDKEVPVSVWVGIDIGKEVHYAIALDDAGTELLCREIANRQQELERLVADVSELGEAVFALDMTEGPAALALAVLATAHCEVRYVAGLSVNRSRTMLAGESKTDRRDAKTIAENLRLRCRSLPRFAPVDETLTSLKLLLRRRTDLSTDRTRSIQRLRDQLLGYFPELERAFDFTKRGPLLLVAHCNTPADIRKAGASRLERRLRTLGVTKADVVAQRAVAAAKGQSLRIPGEATGAAIVSELAAEALHLSERVVETDTAVAEAFFSLPQAEIITSMPGFGPRLGAELLIEIGDLSRFPSAGHLAAYAGLAPVSRDSGKTVGNRMRARGGNKRLKNVLFHAAFIAKRSDPRCRTFYERKRAEGKRHHQAVVALARRRIDVLYAMLKDGTLYLCDSPAP